MRRIFSANWKPGVKNGSRQILAKGGYSNIPMNDVRLLLLHTFYCSVFLCSRVSLGTKTCTAPSDEDEAEVFAVTMPERHSPPSPVPAVHPPPPALPTRRPHSLMVHF